MFLQDLDTILSAPDTKLTARAPYKIWAENTFNLQTSPAAQRSLAWHGNRLKGVNQHKKSLFPEQQSVEWFKGMFILILPN